MPDDKKTRASKKPAAPVAARTTAAKAAPAAKSAARPAAKARAAAPSAPAAAAKAPRKTAAKPVAKKAAAAKPAAPRAAAKKPAVPRTAAKKAAAAKPAVKKAVPPTAPAKKAAGKAAGKAAPAKPRVARGRRPTAGREPVSPDPEGFFVARVRGEDGLRNAPHQLLEGADWEEEAPPAAYEEGLGELPWAYGDDTLVALPRDPRTLYLYWDHARETLQRAFEGLDRAHAQIWLFVRAAGWERIRVVDFALESRGYYLHDLEPGRVYRAEIHLVDRGGREKLIPQVSNPVALPPFGPSPVVDDRFVRIPWEFPLPRLLGPGTPGGPFSEELRALLARLSDWNAWRAAAAAGRPGAGGPDPRPTSPAGGFGGPSSPSSPFGPFGQGGR